MSLPKWQLKKVAVSYVEVVYKDENGNFACLINVPKDYIPPVIDPLAFNLYTGSNGLKAMIDYLKETYPEEYKHWRVPDEDDDF